MFKKLFYVVKYSRQKVKAKHQSPFTQVRKTYELLDSSYLVDFHIKKIPLHEFVMPTNNIETLLNELKRHLKVLPLHVVKAKDISNGNFSVTLETFLVDSKNCYVNIGDTITALKEMVLKLCDYLIPGENSSYGVEEANARLMRGIMRSLLAFGIILHEAIIDLF